MTERPDRDHAADERGYFDVLADEAGAPPVVAPVNSLALPPSRDGALRALGSRARTSAMTRLGRNVAEAAGREAESGLLFLLAPVAMVAGALTYFAAPFEPPAFAILGSGLVLIAAALLLRNRPQLRLAAFALLAALAGVGAGSVETWRASTKMLGSEISTRITGRVVLIEQQASGRTRLTIDLVSTERPKLRFSPDRIRVTARTAPQDLRPGEGVAGVVRLLPPSGPLRPHGFDFSFESYFDGIGANGFFLTSPERAELPAPMTRLQSASAWIAAFRATIAERISSRIAGAEGEIAAALITGVRAGIPEDVNEALRITGLAHVLSISGLHMALVAGTVMVLLRAGFALFPVFASRHPVKKFAAAAALATAFSYLLVSGAQVAAQRSFVMVAVMLVAVMADRAAITMRNLALATIVIVAVAPHEVVGPSFQMSFAATAALIAAYAAWTEWRRGRPVAAWAERSWPERALRTLVAGLVGIAATSIVAGAATALYGAWHFHRIAPMGLPANLAAMPLVTLVVMPAAVVAAFLMPFGLEGWALDAMGAGIRGMIAVASYLAGLAPVDAVGALPLAAVLCLTVALLVACLLRTWPRVVAVPFLIAGTVLLAQRELPDLVVEEEAALVALRIGADSLAVNRPRPREFVISNWQRAMAAERIVKPQRMAAGPSSGEASPQEPTAGEAGQGQTFVCGDGVCFARAPSGALVIHAATADAARSFCAEAAVIIVADPTARTVCAPDGATFVTARDLARRGAAEIWLPDPDLSGPIARASTIRHAIAEPFRPWHAHRKFSRAARGLPPWQRKRAEAPAGAAADTVNNGG